MSDNTTTHSQPSWFGRLAHILLPTSMMKAVLGKMIWQAAFSALFTGLAWLVSGQQFVSFTGSQNIQRKYFLRFAGPFLAAVLIPRFQVHILAFPSKFRDVMSQKLPFH
jgi:hypothetical protein